MDGRTNLTKTPAERADAEEGPIGPFPNWKTLYWTVVIYTGLLIAALQWMTTALDHSSR